MLALMQTMHALGLMPTETFEVERARLVELITRDGWTTSPLNLDAWIRSAEEPYDLDLTKVSILGSFDARPFDWRAVIADFLKATYRDANWDKVREEICRLGVEADYEGGLSVSTLHMEKWRARSMALEQQREMRDEIETLKEDVRQLRQTLASVAMRAEPSISDTTNSRSNSAEIEALQAEIQSYRWAAGDAEARGDHSSASRLFGQVEKLHSKLRALGA